MNQVLHRCTTNSVLELSLMTKNLGANYPTLARKDTSEHIQNISVGHYM